MNVKEGFDEWCRRLTRVTVICDSEETRTLRILYEEVDESDVEILRIFAPTSADSGGIDEYRYPRAGSPNARSVLKIAEFRVNRLGPVSYVILLSVFLSLSLSVLF